MQAALPTDANLATPVAPPKAHGLVSRSSVIWVVLAVVLVLALLIVLDVVGASQKTAEAQKAASTQNNPTGTVGRVGPAPDKSEVDRIADGQIGRVQPPAGTASAPQRVGPEVVIPAGATGPDRSPAGSPAPNMPHGQGNPVMAAAIGGDLAGRSPNQRGQHSDAYAARVQREASAAESKIFAIESGGPGIGGAGGSADALSDAIDRQKQALRTAGIGGAGGDNSINELVRLAAAAMQSGQAAGNVLPGSAARGVTAPDQAWLKEQVGSKATDAAVVRPPASPWVLLQGTRIGIVTREAINSDLPGSLTAMATEPIYDSLRQCAVLVPVGTRFYGAYSSDIRPGQQRVLLAFRRMVLPNGGSVELEGTQGVDPQGASGVEGDVNNHFLKMFGYGFATALLASHANGGASVTTTQPNGSASTTSVAAQVLSDIGGRIMNRNANIPPTITLDPGARMFVTLGRDVAFSPESVNRSKCP